MRALAQGKQSFHAIAWDTRFVSVHRQRLASAAPPKAPCWNLEACVYLFIFIPTSNWTWRRIITKTRLIHSSSIKRYQSSQNQWTLAKLSLAKLGLMGKIKYRIKLQPDA